MVFQIAALFALVCGGIAAGDMFCTTVGLAPMMQVLSYERYVQMVQYLQPRYDPAIPIINTTAFVANVVAAFTAPSPTLFVVAAALVAAVIAVSVAKAVPINRFVLNLDSGTEPEDWPRQDPRARWRAWNTARTVFMVGALVADAVAVLH